MNIYNTHPHTGTACPLWTECHHCSKPLQLEQGDLITDDAERHTVVIEGQPVCEDCANA